MVWGSVTPLTVHRRGSLSYNPCIDNFETPFRPSQLQTKVVLNKPGEQKKSRSFDSKDQSYGVTELL